MASTDKTPQPAEKISERVGDLLAASEGRVRELEAEVEDALRGQDKLRGQLLKELAEVGGLQAEVIRLRQQRDEQERAKKNWHAAYHAEHVRVEKLREAGEALSEVLLSTVYQPKGFTGPPPWWNDKAREAIREWALVASPDKPPCDGSHSCPE